MKKFLVGFIVGLLVTMSIGVSASTQNIIEVFYSNIKLVVDGQEVKFGKDSKGNNIEPFIYNGTTYLPVRAVGESIGRNVKWDGDTQTVYLNKKYAIPSSGFPNISKGVTITVENSDYDKDYVRVSFSVDSSQLPEFAKNAVYVYAYFGQTEIEDQLIVDSIEETLKHSDSGIIDSPLETSIEVGEIGEQYIAVALLDKEQNILGVYHTINKIDLLRK